MHVNRHHLAGFQCCATTDYICLISGINQSYWQKCFFFILDKWKELSFPFKIWSFQQNNTGEQQWCYQKKWDQELWPIFHLDRARMDLCNALPFWRLGDMEGHSNQTHTKIFFLSVTVKITLDILAEKCFWNSIKLLFY